MFQLSHFKIGLEILISNTPLNGRIIAAVPFNAHPQTSQNFPHSIKVVQKLCGFTGVRVATAPCGLADPKSHQEKRRRDDTALRLYLISS